ncbi:MULTISPECIES: sensor domain-containing diguanylate cyclase [unclassified Cyanobium]|uniref:sensor domain-containing diguanylate cyclase n=1 Tax=unclassified Cyanobium TaxID=2627006 RepID=UPI0020CCE804|nr:MULTISPECIES: sensor domain-containing diguanylate cyclase [unclassified Cyanobium]MCP9834554.1 sensor domain-containing diguanylate cyclase [Cyanobium sp. La Preciosa 7G6]MCP9937317.1 sensor domain-containing diguanylate cyclase [Cyanobium sp. Aljojuca 7A6]
MPAYPIPDNEALRQAALDEHHILDTEPDEDFNRITRLASQMLGVPIALISLVDRQRQWFLSRVGLEASETPREQAFCAHAICSDDVMVVSDATEDERFKDNPLVTGDPHIRFYAGVPLQSRTGFNLGTLCVISPEPRQLASGEHQLLQDLAGMVTQYLESRRNGYLCPLTGLQNRRPFFEAGQREFLRARQSGEALTLMLIGLDDFQSFRARFGSQQGERVLQEVAKTLQAGLGDSALVGRVTEAEFAVLRTGLEAREGHAQAESLRAGLALQGWLVDGVRHPLPVSRSVASLSAEDAGFRDLFQRAETALNQARLSGMAAGD